MTNPHPSEWLQALGGVEWILQVGVSTPPRVFNHSEGFD